MKFSSTEGAVVLRAGRADELSLPVHLAFFAF